VKIISKKSIHKEFNLRHIFELSLSFWEPTYAPFHRPHNIWIYTFTFLKPLEFFFFCSKIESKDFRITFASYWLLTSLKIVVSWCSMDVRNDLERVAKNERLTTHMQPLGSYSTVSYKYLSTKVRRRPVDH
jgi:hypothetical protein